MSIAIIFLTLLASLCNVTTAQDSGKGASASSTDVSVGCFSGDSLVMLANGARKQIGYLEIGDEILSVNQLKIISSEMFIMIDQEPSKQARFYTFHTASAHQISLTSLHLIPILYSNNTINYIPAKEVKLGDGLYVLINQQLKSSAIINITIEFKAGYFAPLTMTGTILVNDIFVSCFASVKNHQLAQIFLAPFRWYYQFTRLISVIEPFENNGIDGIHWLFKFIYQFVSYIQPSVLQHS